MDRQGIRRLVLAAMFLGIGYVLPFLTGQVQAIGNMLLPMHLPVLLCGILCGWRYGAAVGLILPLSRSLIFTMPVFYPFAIAMAVELAVYGGVMGVLCHGTRRHGFPYIYGSLLVTMLAGRIAWGLTMTLLLGLGDNGFTWSAFIGGAFLNAIPGIILQLILIPAILLILERTHALPGSHAPQEGSPHE